MELDTIKKLLIEAIKQILEEDLHLFIHNISERAITHRLGMSLTPKFAEFDVDCEYNGNVDAHNGRKYINILKDRAQQLGLLNSHVFVLDQELIDRPVYPDIVVHRRGKNGPENNLLIVEVKKSSSRENREWDAEKLARFTSDEYENNFNYRLGAFVLFCVGEKPSHTIAWYQSGRRYCDEDS